MDVDDLVVFTIRYVLFFFLVYLFEFFQSSCVFFVCIWLIGCSFMFVLLALVQLVFVCLGSLSCLDSVLFGSICLVVG